MHTDFLSGIYLKGKDSLKDLGIGENIIL